MCVCTTMLLSSQSTVLIKVRRVQTLRGDICNLRGERVYIIFIVAILILSSIDRLPGVMINNLEMRVMKFEKKVSSTSLLSVSKRDIYSWVFFCRPSLRIGEGSHRREKNN